MSYWSQPQIHCLPSPYVPVVGVPLYSDRLKTYASGLVQCVIIMASCEPVVDDVSCLSLAMLVPVHKAMRDEGFAAGTDSSWVKLHIRV